MGHTDSRQSKSEGNHPAQDAQSARASSMPQSAIAGCVDFIGSPERIAKNSSGSVATHQSNRRTLRKQRSVMMEGLNASSILADSACVTPENGRGFHRV